MASADELDMGQDVADEDDQAGVKTVTSTATKTCSSTSKDDTAKERAAKIKAAGKEYDRQSRKERLKALLGRGPKTEKAASAEYGHGRWMLYQALAAMLTAAVVLGLYLVVMALASQVMPQLSMLMSQYIDVPLTNLSNQGALVYWIIPSMFVLLVMVGLTLSLMKAVWVWRTKVLARLRTRLLGERVLS